MELLLLQRLLLHWLALELLGRHVARLLIRRQSRHELRVCGLAGHRAVHRHAVPVHPRHGRPEPLGLGVALRVAPGVAVAHGRHGGDVGVGVALGHLTHLDHLLHLLLALVLELVVFLLGEDVLGLVQSVPALVLVVLIPLGLGQELVVADHPVLVLV